MMIDDFRAHILSLYKDPQFNSEIAQIQSKALLSEVTNEIPPYFWTYIVERIIRNLTVSTFELEAILKEHPDAIDEELSKAARKFALTWESLAKLEESTSRELALINAAINYELANYQANSMCIANQLVARMDFEDKAPSIAQMSAIFLQRRFLQLLNISLRLQNKPGIIKDLRIPPVEYLGLILSLNAYRQIIQFFLSGDEQSYDNGVNAFKIAEKMFISIGSIEESNLSRYILNLLPIMKSRSIWSQLSTYAPDNPKWIRYLKLLARGLGSDILRSRSISELWPSQIYAIKSNLFSSSSSKVIRMPTSAGKTRIAELAMIYTLINNPNSKCVYVAPYRALVSELEQSFFNLLSDLGYRVSSITGTYESNDFEELLFYETDLLVVTPEKLDLLLRAKPELLDAVKLFVLDEAHIIQDSVRGIKFELLITRLMRKLPTARIIALSAVVPQETLEDFAKWFCASTRDDILSTSWRPSIQRYAKFEWRGRAGIIRYAPDEDNNILNEFVPGVIEQHTYEYLNPDTQRLNHKRFPDISNKAQLAAELAYKFAELGPVLVFCSQTNHVQSVANALYERLDLALRSGISIPNYFSGNLETRSSMISHEWLGDRPLAKWLKSGIGIHYGSLPEVLRKSVEADFRGRGLRVLIATNTLAQGVNLPVKTVIVHSCRRYLDESHPNERISARDYWNIAGRAGRAGEETEGLIIHIATSAQDKVDFEYFKRLRNNVEPVESALYQVLKGLAEDRISEEALENELDPEILALLVEECPESFSCDIENLFEDILNKSLVHIQAERHNRSIQPLNIAFKSIARNITSRIPNQEYISVFSSTGLSTTSCQIIYNHICANKAYLYDLLTDNTPENRNSLIDFVFPVCMLLSEMKPSHDFGGSYIDLLKQWVRGEELQNLLARFRVQSISLEDLGRFIDDLFGYRLPWGFSGYLRIAMHVLDLSDDNLSPIAKFLPSMIKYGLPTPIACWVMSLGIPYRKVAIDISSKFQDEVGLSYNYEEFLRWLAGLSSEYIKYDLNLKSPFLEDISRIIFTASLNSLLRDLTSIDELLPCEIEIKGIQYENRSLAVSNISVGQKVILFRDYDNIVDRNAIGIKLSNDELGYVPRDIAQILAPEIDTGSQFKAIISRVHKNLPIPKVYVRIE